MENKGQDIKQTKFIVTKFLGKKTYSIQKEVSVLDFFNAKLVQNTTPRMLPGAESDDKTVVQLLSITNYVMRNICNAHKNLLTSKLNGNHFNNLIKENFANNLRENLNSFSESNKRYI